MIEQSFIQELLDRIDIVDIVGRYLQLKKAGANFTACCPFHNEKTPALAGHFRREKQRHINHPVVSVELKYSAGDRDN